MSTPVISRRQLGASEEFLVRFSLRFIYCAQRSRSWIRSIFLLSDDLRNFHSK